MSITMTIGDRSIGSDHPTYVIAEIGINHNGDPELFRRMIRAVRDAGADAVKVQIVDAAKSYARTSPSYELFRRVEFDRATWRALVTDARAIEISVFATVTEPDALWFAVDLDLPALKVSSSNLTNVPLLRVIAETGKPIILSTGMSYLSEVDDAVRELEAHGCTQLAVLQCTSRYPTEPSDVNLRTLATLRNAFPYPIGFSDHTVGTTCSVAAVALGAKLIEKHVTLDRSLPGPDHHFSATPEEFATLVRAIRDVEAALGTPRKQPLAAELLDRQQLRRVLVAARDIVAGETFSVENVALKRATADGFDSKYYDAVIGRRARRAITRDESIHFEALL